MIDLHTHTTYSDGTWTVEKLLKEAQKIGLEVLSITDHDNVKANKEISENKYKDIFNGKIIYGVELNTVFNGVKMELLAYGFDIEQIDKWTREKYTNKKINLKREFEMMVESARKNNIKIGDVIYDETKGWPIDIIFPEIKKYEENKIFFKDEKWDNIDSFFSASTSDPTFPVYVDLSIHYPIAREVSNIIRAAGGKVFVAHVYRYPVKDHKKLLDNLVRENIIDGVEVYHSSFNKEEIKYLENYCNQNNLLVSGGSDCHGDKKPDRKLGIGYGNLNISKDVINRWINNIYKFN